MAKKKIVTTEEIVEDTPIDYKEDIQDKSMEEIVKETPKEEEPVKEEPVKEEDPKDEEVELDTTQIEETVTKSVTEKMIKALTGGTEVEATIETGNVSPWAKEGRNPRDYDEIAEWSVELVEKKNEAKRLEQERINEEVKAQQVEYSQKRADFYNNQWNEHLEDLTEAGKLPKVVDPNNEEDEGVIARKELFKAMLEVNNDRVAKGKEATYSLKEIYYEHYTPKSKQPAGADAPVSAGRSSAPAANDEEYPYVGNRSFFDILRGK